MTKNFFNIKEYAYGEVIAFLSSRTIEDTNCYTGYTTDTVYSNGTSDRTYWGFYGTKEDVLKEWPEAVFV